MPFDSFAFLKNASITFVICLLVQNLHASEIDTPKQIKTNLEAMQDLISEIANEIANRSHLSQGDSITINVHSGEESWIGMEAITSTLQSRGYHIFSQVTLSDEQQYLLSVISMHYRVRYTDMFREGLIGTKKVKRNVLGSVTCQILNTGSSEVLFSGTLSKEFEDTVLVADIPNLELGSAKSTHAELPSESFLDRFAQPLIIIGATGVAVYLLFQVRSK
ncbi:MAG: hypothetical protein HY707_00930 [Ignavibacteriae bacterium]|nr:hypothetical protein [Ignavibacteriota bacterium]